MTNHYLIRTEPEGRQKGDTGDSLSGGQKGDTARPKRETSHANLRRCIRKNKSVKESVGAHTPFSPPTTEEVRAYAESIDFETLNAAKFVNHYGATGWKIRGSSVEDWKALVCRWQAEDAERAGKAAEAEDANDPTEEEARRLLGWSDDQEGGAV